MSNERVPPSFIHEKMKSKIEIIEAFCESFNEESEFFLYPLYSIVASSMTEVAIKTAVLSERGVFTNRAVLMAIIESFEKQIDKLKKSIDLCESDKERSHNEQLVERLLKEVGLSEDLK